MTRVLVGFAALWVVGCPGESTRDAGSSVIEVTTPSADARAASGDAGDVVRSCPAPREASDGPCPTGSFWAKDVSAATPTCCPYASHCSTPEGWPTFATEQACLSDCECGPIESQIYSRTTLECGCSNGACYADFTAGRAGVCQPERQPGLVTVSRGCGRIALAERGALHSEEWVFDAVMGKLIGFSTVIDTALPPCLAPGRIAGAAFACDGAEVCQLCGAADPAFTACEP